MGKVYAIANQKGGVGKTTTAVNVAACIAEAGYATLVFDVPPQANATVGLGLPRSQTPGLYEFLSGESPPGESIVDSSGEKLSIPPASPELAGAKVEPPRIDGFERKLREAIEPIRD